MDNNIEKALEICKNPITGCKGCPFEQLKAEDCLLEMIDNAIKLINRQKAEIKKLKNSLEERKPEDAISAWNGGKR